ncbi:MAG: thymidylate synthase, flavin-dependent [Candidatus Schekmanbacteria bacterium RIFCSPHIGHO2_02_FULL_38_11]|uniref:Flavin-dependent thymidylate synthase n=1 Tax=Candidatus Schekmanbacteria bacterium RIFCSPLOWO2_12_FULL_38_15 TaxID=1817883 RepID=A0A1F7SE98_9BACT|nr:MAG: thymidylate synthase, flavin-dependent [Candidatus Schekmanbacteria bacterium GWA2_38_9]OGL48978.1 MAG: thymidylate synthase, flavin-dependent [Candidatus Schekmanbacteria bacterium RIFCSPHIGHO2_02_FULL_38_11]OGL49133.1 MAG: thymidylate synthase, flavin-dependent [Candidatus Schekmanbacteria bacterium RIFCSPLOWO2_02_FULL_38_14]OGL52109.1 MAG: thymidylate synthase, flavin-dependent [Candidatus Schekmanbacteria bacterium RIFCSPLOWO2_12_FULL_38_15]
MKPNFQVDLLAITPDCEKLIEEAGRTCYLSFGKIGKGSEKKFIKMLIKSGHLSVLEHAYATFRIKGGSRAFTHQLVRHRICSFSQQSQRYVSEKEFDFITPHSIRKNSEALKLFNETMELLKENYQKLQAMGIKNEDARFVLPNAIKSEIVISANLREWRYILQLRCAPDAQWEIRGICNEILKILKKEAPVVFEDFELDGDKKVAIVK